MWYPLWQFWQARKNRCSHTQQLDWYLHQENKCSHCWKVFLLSADSMAGHHRNSRNLRMIDRYLVGPCMRKYSHLYELHLSPDPLDSYMAAGLGIWPGYTYHTCWLGEAALVSIRLTRSEICQTRTLSISPLSMVHIPCRYNAFPQVKLAAGWHPRRNWVVFPRSGMQSNLPILARHPIVNSNT